MHACGALGREVAPYVAEGLVVNANTIVRYRGTHPTMRLWYFPLLRSGPLAALRPAIPAILVVDHFVQQGTDLSVAGVAPTSASTAPVSCGATAEPIERDADAVKDHANWGVLEAAFEPHLGNGVGMGKVLVARRDSLEQGARDESLRQVRRAKHRMAPFDALARLSWDHHERCRLPMQRQCERAPLAPPPAGTI